MGRLEGVKNHYMLISAVKKLKSSNPVLVQNLKVIIIGDGSLRQELDNKIKHLKLEEICLLAGPRNEIQDIMNLFKIFVLPSLAEGMSNTILEAMACGCPVIATSVGGNGELVQDAKNGFLVESNNSDTLSEKIKMYLEDESLIHRHAKEARNIVCKNYSLDKMVHDYYQLYSNNLVKK